MRRHSANLYLILFKCRENMVCHNANLSHILFQYNAHDFHAIPIEIQPPQVTATNILVGCVIDFTCLPSFNCCCSPNALFSPTHHHCPYRNRSSECRHTASLIAVFSKQRVCPAVIANQMILPPKNPS